MSGARHAYGLAVTSFLGLFLLVLGWHLLIAPPAREYISLAILLHAGPLLLPLRGVLSGRRYTYKWSGMLIFVYFAHGIASMANPGPARWLGLGEALLSVLFFLGALYYVRQTRALAD